LYCIELYLYIYIALLAVHTNQKRFKCERPREKRAVCIIGLSLIGDGRLDGVVGGNYTVVFRSLRVTWH